MDEATVRRADKHSGSGASAVVTDRAVALRETLDATPPDAQTVGEQGAMTEWLHRPADSRRDSHELITSGSPEAQSMSSMVIGSLRIRRPVAW